MKTSKRDEVSRQMQERNAMNGAFTIAVDRTRRFGSKLIVKEDNVVKELSSRQATRFYNDKK